MSQMAFRSEADPHAVFDLVKDDGCRKELTVWSIWTDCSSFQNRSLKGSSCLNSVEKENE